MASHTSATTPNGATSDVAHEPNRENVISRPQNPDDKANPFAALIPDQYIATVPSFTLESGVTLENVPVAYSTKGRLNAEKNNVLVICHALSGSADVADWWGPLIGPPGKAFDLSRFYVVCLNSLGSPYGTASPVTYVDGDPTKGTYGPEFPPTTIKDDVNLHKIVLDHLGVRQIAAAVGGSMGGMLVLEYAYFGKDYVRSIVPIATSSQHSAWGISWGEAQRQAIYTDPKYEDGYYSFDDPPASGLGSARMQALLTYRSRNSFEERFGRKFPNESQSTKAKGTHNGLQRSNSHFAIHNDGHKTSGSPRPHPSTPPRTPPSEPAPVIDPPAFTDPQFHGATPMQPPTPPTPLAEGQRKATTYSAQSYLRYQGQKFVSRFDSNCYISITRKLDTHDITQHVPPSDPLLTSVPTPENPNPRVRAALARIQQPALVLGIESDGLFTFAEQQEIADGISDSRLKKIESPEGHDAFLLQFKQVNAFVVEFFKEVLPDIMEKQGIEDWEGKVNGVDDEVAGGEGWNVKKESTFGEAEGKGEVGDFTAW